MKTTISIIACVALCACTPRYQGTRTPLQPGDKVIFKSDGASRANQFRRDSLNDSTHTGSVVEITRPATIVTE